MTRGDFLQSLLKHFKKQYCFWMFSNLFSQMLSNTISKSPKKSLSHFLFKKKLQFLWDIEQKVYLISSYQRISCLKELFQQTSLKNSKFLQSFDTLRRVFVFRFHYSSWPAWRIKNRRITLTFGGSLYIRVVLHFEQKHWVWRLSICILRFQGNKLKKPFSGFKKLILLLKLIECIILTGLLNFQPPSTVEQF